MDTPIPATDRIVPPDVQIAATEELNRLEHRLELFKAKLEVIRPLHLEVDYSLRKIKETIDTLESQIGVLRQGQLLMPGVE